MINFHYPVIEYSRTLYTYIRATVLYKYIDTRAISPIIYMSRRRWQYYNIKYTVISIAGESEKVCFFWFCLPAVNWRRRRRRRRRCVYTCERVTPLFGSSSMLLSVPQPRLRLVYSRRRAWILLWHAATFAPLFAAAETRLFCDNMRRVAADGLDATPNAREWVCKVLCCALNYIEGEGGGGMRKRDRDIRKSEVYTAVRLCFYIHYYSCVIGCVWRDNACYIYVRCWPRPCRWRDDQVFLYILRSSVYMYICHDDFGDNAPSRSILIIFASRYSWCSRHLFGYEHTGFAESFWSTRGNDSIDRGTIDTLNCAGESSLDTWLPTADLYGDKLLRRSETRMIILYISWLLRRIYIEDIDRVKTVSCHAQTLSTCAHICIRYLELSCLYIYSSLAISFIFICRLLCIALSVITKLLSFKQCR